MLMIQAQKQNQKLAVFLMLTVAATITIVTITSEVKAADIYPAYTNSHFTVNFPPAWNVFNTMPGQIIFNPPDNSTALIRIDWASPAPNWLLDKGVTSS